ncbi:hypothetical protein ACFY4H_06975 [Streptomyces althioticus]|uniref:hypothetical protein n=1 Tax=Streptomyces althioticus TaxID=83380 RepID=UPI0036C43E51
MPPAVATAGQARVGPYALPPDGFATEVVEFLARKPAPREILVEGVRQHRWAGRNARMTSWSPSGPRPRPVCRGRRD